MANAAKATTAWAMAVVTAHRRATVITSAEASLGSVNPKLRSANGAFSAAASWSLSDETLLKKLAGSNPELRKQLRQLLGRDNLPDHHQSWFVNQVLRHAHKRVQQYRGLRDLLERLTRDLRALQQATTAAVAFDCAITYRCTAWGLTTGF
jgi:hypothetical protein